MKFLLFLLIAFVFCSKIDDSVLRSVSLKNGKTNIMINLKAQVDWTKYPSLEDMEWVPKGEFVLRKLQSLSSKTQPKIINILKNHNIDYTAFYVQNSIAAFNVPEALIYQLAEFEDISRIFSAEAIEQDLPTPLPHQTIIPTQNDVEWNIEWINATRLWKLGFNGTGTIVASADTGVLHTHPSLKSNYRGLKKNGTYDHNYNWADGVTNARFPQCRSSCGCSTKAPCDDQGHGTHTVSTAAGGVDKKIGVSPGSKWIGCRAFSDMGRHWATPTFLTCLEFFLAPTDLEGKNPKPKKRPHTTIHSYGCQAQLGCPNHNDMEPAAKALRAAGVLMSVAAQNAGPGCGSVNRQPAHYESVVSVGALGVKTNLIAAFSSRGPVKIDGSNRRKPDVAAPGTSILSAYLGNRYTQMSGTSMAAPHVAGAWALFWSAVPKLVGKIETTAKIFEKTAAHQKSRDCESSVESPNNVYGYGTIDVFAAYEEAKRMGY